MDMTGWKTIVGSVGLILVGVGGVLQAVATGDWGTAKASLLTALGGLTALGIGHKVDKLIRSIMGR
jgi:hypothetical protein